MQSECGGERKGGLVAALGVDGSSEGEKEKCPNKIITNEIIYFMFGKLRDCRAEY